MNKQEIKYTGKFAGGLKNDIQKKLKFYISDFKDGMHSSVLGTTLFMFFAALANAIAFGALNSHVTGNEMGIVEMIVVTAIGGIIFSLFSGQPLIILGGTGPIVIFTGLLYSLCKSNGIEFMPTYAWVGIWSGIFLLIGAFLDASYLIKFFTRFTDEIFAALISVIFIVEAVKNIAKSFEATKLNAAGSTDVLSSGFLTIILALGTFMLASRLKKFSKTHYMSLRFRNFISDFGPSIAIGIMTAVAFYFSDVKIEVPKVPSTISTTTGRPWLVDLLSVPVWVIFGSIIPAILVTILLFLDQNITSRIANSPDFKLKKDYGYHLDLLVVSVITIVASFFGLPWIVAATVHSLNHNKSLATTEIIIQPDGSKKEVITGVRENRVSGLMIHLLIGGSLFLLSYFGSIPMAVLFGLFLYMGFVSLGGNQFYDRIILWFTDKELIPDNHYTRIVPMKNIKKFTLIQLACFIGLWVLKSSKIGILFPLFIAALVPINNWINTLFPKEQINAIMSEDKLEEEEDDHYLG